jgi:hypothetical protein
MSVTEEFRKDRVVFLAKLYEMCKYDSKIPADAFEVGRQVSFDDEKTTRTVNYLLEKGSIKKSEWIPINTGDPRPVQNFLIVFITSAGIDELEDKEPKTSVPDIHHHYGNTYQTEIKDVDKSNIQISTQGSTQTTNISEAKNKEFTEILNQLKNKFGDLPPEQTVEIQSEIIKIENELTSRNHDKNRVENAIGSLYNKIKVITPLLGIAIQIANWFKTA